MTFHWKTTAGSIDLRTSDDFIATGEGLMLRAEDMGDRFWWMAVYDGDEQEPIIDDFPTPRCRPADARQICESIAAAYLAGKRKGREA